MISGHYRSFASKKLPYFLQTLSLKNLKLGYHYLISNLLNLCIIYLIVITSIEASRMNPEDFQKLKLQLQRNPISLILFSALLIFSLTFYYMTRPRTIYLIDFACYKPPDEFKIPRTVYVERARLMGCFREETVQFQRKILENSGLGDETYAPRLAHGHPIPLRPPMSAGKEETEQVICGALDNLFASMNVNPKHIGILIVNSSAFNPMPSFSSMIIAKYKLRSNISSFNLGGMGCSASVIAIDLAKNLLKVHGNTYALVVSTENITMNGYVGNNKPMLVTNCLFRVGGAAILLSNKSRDKKQAKYKLVHVLRTHLAADDKAYLCVQQEEDCTGKIGVFLSKDLMSIASEALKTNMSKLGPLVLPISEQILFVVNLIVKKLFNKNMKAYTPDFKLAFDHFCIHAGGKAVINELEKSLQLSAEDVEASRMTLHRFGNTSSSSIWYVLAYIEAKRRIHMGDRVWQIALGSGFKCNSAVWEAISNVNSSPNNNPWDDCIHKYPVDRSITT